MNKISLVLGFLLSVGLAACSTNSDNANMASHANSGAANANGGGTSIGGNVQSSMDEIDKSKMSHALDNAIGKSSHWVNNNTGIAYTVTPTEKVDVNGYTFCRKYNAMAEKNNN